MEAYSNQDAHKDVTSQFKRYKSDALSTQELIGEAKRIIDKFIAVNGFPPASTVLDRLGTLILSGDSTNTLSNKTRTEEYPVLSENQYRRRTEGRHKGRLSKDGKLKPLTREVPLSLAVNHAVDGRDYSYPTRRNLDVLEQMDIEYYGKGGNGDD